MDFSLYKGYPSGDVCGRARGNGNENSGVGSREPEASKHDGDKASVVVVGGKCAVLRGH